MRIESSSQPNEQVLRGLNIIVTRPKHTAAALSEPLKANGAHPIEVPVIQFGQPEDPAPIESAVDELRKGVYDWAIFTSVNGVSYTWERLIQNGFAEGEALDCKIAAIGPATAKALQDRGIKVDYIPEIYIAEEIAEGLGDVERLQVLLPRADIARKALPNMLRDRGALVNEVVAYRTVEADPDSSEIAEASKLIQHDEIDWVTFTSSSTVVHFMNLFKEAGIYEDRLRDLKVACIGPITEETARSMSLNIQVVASQHDIPGLVDALIEAVKKND